MSRLSCVRVHEDKRFFYVFALVILATVFDVAMDDIIVVDTNVAVQISA